MKGRTMLQRVEDYVTYRSKLGFVVGTSENHLRSIAKHIDKTCYRGPITSKLALRWATMSTKAHPVTWDKRLSLLRGFARFESLTNPATEVPPMRLLGVRKRRIPPHIYSKREMRDLLRAASKLRRLGCGLAPHTFTTLFGLLSSTGLRLGEAMRLTLADINLKEGVISILRTKFRKSRFVPIHATVVAALRRYIERRSAACPNDGTGRLFLNNFGRPLAQEWVEKMFRRIRAKLRWTKTGGRLPRLHDFRHTFAVTRLTRWYAEGANVDRKIASLATYLGHSEITYTYWYLSATPELLALSGRRFERYAHIVPKGLL